MAWRWLYPSQGLEGVPPEPGCVPKLTHYPQLAPYTRPLRCAVIKSFRRLTVTHLNKDGHFGDVAGRRYCTVGS